MSNLARHGWDSFGGANAAPLAFPLHAIADAAAPHHVTGTSSWGHRPFEDGVAFIQNELLPAKDDPAFLGMRDRVLAIALQALQGFDDDPSIENYVIREATITRGLAAADDDWVFKDVSSEAYFDYGIGSRSSSIDEYRKSSSHLRPFVEHSLGHTIAFLVKVGERIGDIDPGVEPTTRCADGAHFTGVVPGCGPAPGAWPSSSLPSEVALTSSACVRTGDACGRTSDCCDGAALCQSGTCVRPAPPPPPQACSNPANACSSHADCGSHFCVDGCCDLGVE